MVNHKFKSSPRSGRRAKGRKLVTVPDQSMSIKEIVRRFVRGLPVDAIIREKIFIDQDEFDFEKMANQGLADKAFAASEQQLQSEYLRSKVEDEQRERARLEDEIKAEKLKTESAGKRSGIDSLDNTMPDDTKQKTK